MTRNQRAIALLLLASLNAFGFIDRVVVALVAQQVKAEFLLSDFDIGLLGGTVFALVNTFAAIPVARLAERFKRAHVTAAFLMIGSLFTTFAGLTVSFGQLLVCRLGMACGSAATEAPPHSMISDMYPPGKRASAISIFMLGVPVAALLGSFAGGAIAQSFGWRRTFLFFGLMGCVISLLCFAFLREPARQTAAVREGPKPGTMHVAGIMLRSTALRYIVLGACFVSFASFGVNTFLPSLLSRRVRAEHGAGGPRLRPDLGHRLARRHAGRGYVSEHLARRDPRWLLGFPALGSFIGAPLFIIGVGSGSLMVAIPLMLVGSFAFYTAMGPCIATLHGSLDSYTRATGSALFLMVMHLVGQGLGPPLAGIVSDSFSATLYGGGPFATDCAGAAAQIAGSACAAASAGGLRYAVMAFASFHFVAGTLALSGRARRPCRSDLMRENAMQNRKLIVKAALLAAASGAMLAIAAPAAAKDCSALANIPLNQGKVTAATLVPAGTFQQPSTGAPLPPGVAGAAYKNVPAFCRIEATMSPTPDSDIKVEIWLPVSGWNGKLVGLGNGVWAGQLSYSQMADPVTRGFAVVTTDTGHKGSGLTARMGSRASREARRFRPPRRPPDDGRGQAGDHGLLWLGPKLSYWNSCSTGGRQGLMAAYRYPNDFDAISAMAPANPMTDLMTQSMWAASAARKTPASALNPALLSLIHKAVVEKCDGLDGLRDGLVGNPRACTFKPAALICKPGQSGGCLNADQAAAMQAIYDGVRDPRTGKVLLPGWPVGSEMQLAVVMSPTPFPVANDYFKLLVHARDAGWDWTKMDYGKETADARNMAATF